MNDSTLTASAEPSSGKIVVVAIHCDDIPTVAHENGLEVNDIRSTYGPMTYDEAKEFALNMIANGAPTRLNLGLNRHFPITLPVHEVILAIPNDGDGDDEIIETFVARHFDFSECGGLDPHEAGEAF